MPATRPCLFNTTCWSDCSLLRIETRRARTTRECGAEMTAIHSCERQPRHQGLTRTAPNCRPPRAALRSPTAPTHFPGYPMPDHLQLGPERPDERPVLTRGGSNPMTIASNQCVTHSALSVQQARAANRVTTLSPQNSTKQTLTARRLRRFREAVMISRRRTSADSTV